MKLLIITPRIPYPPFRGDKLKIFNLAKVLAKTNSVTILTFHESRKNLANIQSLEEFGINVKSVWLPVVDSLWNMIKAVFSKLPFQVAYFSSKKMEDEINALVKKNDFDVIYFHLIRSAQYYDTVAKSSALKVLDFTDAVSLYLSRFAEVTKNPFKKIALRLELRRVEKYETVGQKFDTLFICSEKDKEYLSDKNLHKNIQYLRNGF
ncbi:MAG: hypothetical protein AB1298_06015, partial [Bacteroidota bacterium]